MLFRWPKLWERIASACRVIFSSGARSTSVMGNVPSGSASLSAMDDGAARAFEAAGGAAGRSRSEEHTSELQSLMRISYAVFCLKKKTKKTTSIHKVRYTMHQT